MFASTVVSQADRGWHVGARYWAAAALIRDQQLNQESDELVGLPLTPEADSPAAPARSLAVSDWRIAGYLSSCHCPQALSRLAGCDLVLVGVLRKQLLKAGVF
jgi:hypothetical protein